MNPIKQRYVQLYLVVRYESFDGMKSPRPLVDADGRVFATDNYERARDEAAEFGGIVTNWTAFKLHILPRVNGAPVGLRIYVVIHGTARTFLAKIDVADADLLALNQLFGKWANKNHPIKEARAQQIAGIAEEVA